MRHRRAFLLSLLQCCMEPSGRGGASSAQRGRDGPRLCTVAIFIDAGARARDGHPQTVAIVSHCHPTPPSPPISSMPIWKRWPGISIPSPSTSTSGRLAGLSLLRPHLSSSTPLLIQGCCGPAAMDAVAEVEHTLKTIHIEPRTTPPKASVSRLPAKRSSTRQDGPV